MSRMLIIETNPETVREVNFITLNCVQNTVAKTHFEMQMTNTSDEEIMLEAGRVIDRVLRGTGTVLYTEKFINYK